MFASVNKQTKNLVMIISLILGLGILVNPNAGVDIGLTGILVLLIAHIFLKEKVILLFLLIRPTLDWWRDLILFIYRDNVINLNAAFAILFLFCSSFTHFTYRQSFKKLPLKIPILLFFLVVVISGSLGINPINSAIEAIKLADLILFFWLSYILVYARKISKALFVKTIFVAAVLPMLAALYQLLLGSGLATFDIRGRIFGTLGHPNVFAFLVLSIIILFTDKSVINANDFWENNKLTRFIIYCLLFTLLLFTYTRVTLIGLAIFLVIIGVYKYKKMLTWLVVGTGLFYLTFFPLNNWLVDNANVDLSAIPLVGRITTRNDEADSISWRLSLLRENMPIIRSRPALGYGFGNFEEVWRENRSIEHQWDDSDEAHNDYLRIALELGLTGFIVYIAFLLNLLYVVSKKAFVDKKSLQKNIHLLAWVFIFLVVSLSDNMIRHTPVMWITFSYWGAALAKKKTVDPGSFLNS